MTTGEKIYHLMHWCKASVSIIINPHRDYYQSIYQYLDDINDGSERGRIDHQILLKMVNLDQLVEIHFYPDTPTGSHKIWHYDLDLALDECVEIILNEDAIRSLRKRG